MWRDSCSSRKLAGMDLVCEVLLGENATFSRLFFDRLLTKYDTASVTVVPKRNPERAAEVGDGLDAMVMR